MFARFKQMFARRPPAEFHHSTFGRFEGERGLWTARVQQGAESFDLSLGGSDSAPDERLLSAASRVLARYDELHGVALAFLTAQESLAEREAFTIYGLSFLWEDRPEDFTFEFTMARDDDGIWRVEFVSGAPKFTGRDD